MGGVTFFVIVMMLFFAILPAYRSITDQLKNNEAKTKYLDALKTKKTVLDKLAVSYEDKITEIDNFNLYNNPVSNTETLVANMDIIAKRNNSQLAYIKFTNDPIYKSPDSSAFTGFANLSPVKLDMSFHTKVVNISSLMKALEEFPLTMYFYKIDITQERPVEVASTMTTYPLSTNDSMIIAITGEIYFWNKDK
jgi:hypothetical protein